MPEKRAASTGEGADSRQWPNSLLDFLNPWKDLATAVLGLAGLFYVVGFVVTNTYLSSYGINDFTLLKARYIATGTLFLLLAVLVIYPAYFMTRYLISWVFQKADQLYLDVLKTWATSYATRAQIAAMRRELAQMPTEVAEKCSVLLADEEAALREDPTRKNETDVGSAQSTIMQTLVSYSPQLMSKLYGIYVYSGLLLISGILISGLISATAFAFLSRPWWFGRTDIDMTSWWHWMLNSAFEEFGPWYIGCSIFGVILGVMSGGLLEGTLFSHLLGQQRPKRSALSASRKQLSARESGYKVYGLPPAYWGIMAALFLTLWIIPDFARSIYPLISPALGGGKPSTVQLIADGESAPVVTALIPVEVTYRASPAPKSVGNKVVKSSGQEPVKAIKTVEVEVLDENDTALFLRLKPRATPNQQELWQAIRIDKSLIKATFFKEATHE
jgi:hypothetical protein